MTHNPAAMLGFFVLFFAGLGSLIAVLCWLEASLDRPRETPGALARLWSAGVARVRVRLQPQLPSPVAGQIARLSGVPASGPAPEESQAA